MAETLVHRAVMALAHGPMTLRELKAALDWPLLPSDLHGRLQGGERSGVLERVDGKFALTWWGCEEALKGEALPRRPSHRGYTPPKEVAETRAWRKARLMRERAEARLARETASLLPPPPVAPAPPPPAPKPPPVKLVPLPPLKVYEPPPPEVFAVKAYLGHLYDHSGLSVLCGGTSKTITTGREYEPGGDDGWEGPIADEEGQVSEVVSEQEEDEGEDECPSSSES